MLLSACLRGSQKGWIDGPVTLRHGLAAGCRAASSSILRAVVAEKSEEKEDFDRLWERLYVFAYPRSESSSV